MGWGKDEGKEKMREKEEEAGERQSRVEHGMEEGGAGRLEVAGKDGSIWILAGVVLELEPVAAGGTDGRTTERGRRGPFELSVLGREMSGEGVDGSIPRYTLLN